MELELQGRKVIVTGAANGIGASIYSALLQEGALPIGVDILPDPFSGLLEAMQPKGAVGKMQWFHQGDASDEKEMRLLIRLLDDPSDQIYGLVNCAGLLGGDDAHGGSNAETFDKLMQSHARSTYVMTELVAPLMKKAGTGAVVNIGSIDTMMASYAGVAAYAAAKAAQKGLLVAHAVKFAPEVRVNMVSPGNVNTERNKAQYVHVGELIEGFEGRTPLQRSAEPREIADAVLFLLSPRASFITGANLVVDGGYTRQLWDPSWAPRDVYGQDAIRGKTT